MRLILIFILISLITKAQNITIKGKAHPSHIGKEVVLSDFTDYITYNLVKESSDTIDKDGYFELKLQSKNTKPILLNINNLIGKIYVQPNFVYCIYFRNKCYMCIYISKSNVLLYKIIFHIYLYDIIKLNFGGTKSGQMC